MLISPCTTSCLYSTITYMPINNNLINKIRYTVYTPIYDQLTKTLEDSRKSSIESLNIQSGANVLIVGAGTGLDFNYLNENTHVTATDLTPSMVNQIKKRCRQTHPDAHILVMDGHHLDFEDERFDVVILHLILAVIPDPYKAIKEVERVLKPNGKIAIFDKFIPHQQKISLRRKMVNQITKLLFSDINRNLEKIVATTSLEIISNKPANFNGIFRKVLLKKP